MGRREALQRTRFPAGLLDRQGHRHSEAQLTAFRSSNCIKTQAFLSSDLIFETLGSVVLFCHFSKLNLKLSHFLKAVHLGGSRVEWKVVWVTSIPKLQCESPTGERWVTGRARKCQWKPTLTKVYSKMKELEIYSHREAWQLPFEV